MSDDLLNRARFVVQLFQECDAIQLPHKPTENVLTGMIARIEALEEEVGPVRTEKHADAECIGALEAAIDAALAELDTSPIMNAHICEAKRILRAAREVTK